ncbi:sorting nexin-19 isoform X12 [Eubalaena glacialis]|uniref:sorting nexin-19 isoform X12 n=1 Tax=Eubalaena glacialis TaxID=27606 RepID=UPI002A5A460F|nr:sorting nexin-19 isoform X12 [Eubalaena glacialis]
MEEGRAGLGSPLPPAMKAETATAAQEPPAGPSLSHLLSSRKLVALGAVLGWLLVIHLLVNVWLLCLLSALLLVLGGWLGSDAIVGPSGRLHLERFIPMAVCPPNPEAERQLEQEIDRTIRMVMRDFVSSWYRTPLFLSEDAELESPLSELGKEAIMLMNPGNFLSARIQDSLCALGDSQSLESKDDEGSEGIEGAEAEEGPGTETETGLLVSMLNSCPEIHIDTADKEVEQGDVTSLTTLLASPERMCPPRPSCLEKDLTNGVSSLDPGLPQVLLSSSPPGPLSSATFSFEPLSSPDGPVVIQNLRITGTITAREHSGTGFHPYTLYTVKYETALDGENSSGLQQLAYHTVNRRYREFLNLQTRLEEKSDLRKFIKSQELPQPQNACLLFTSSHPDLRGWRPVDVKGPKKLFPDLPFGNMDSDRVEARKSLLESFLKQLCAIPEIANSEEMQEFLALNTDARIAFVKKPFVVSRIDKVVVSAIVDTLKTAFPRSEPQSPTEELSEAETESKPQPEGKKTTKSRLRFSSSKIAPALNITEAHEKILYCLREGSVESEILSTSGMESFIEKQTKLLETQPAEAPGKDSEQTSKGCVDDCMSDAAVPAQDLSNSDPGTETELADTALDLLLLLLMEQWSWLCTENVQKVIHLIFGTLIQRWLEVQVATLTCPQRWVQYLRLLQESVWPGGLLPECPRPVRTREQKAAAETQALQSLMGVLPDIVVGILGVNKCRLSWSLVLESLQQPLINRCQVVGSWWDQPPFAFGRTRCRPRRELLKRPCQPPGLFFPTPACPCI